MIRYQDATFCYILCPCRLGVPWVQIMKNEFEFELVDRRGLGGYFSEEFVKKDYS